MVEETNQVVHTIKQLLERMVLSPTQSIPRLKFAIEGTQVKQQVTKTTTRGNATLNHRANSQQISRSQAESTRSATTDRRRCDEAGPSRPQNRMTLGPTIWPGVTARSQERRITEDPHRPSHNVFDRLGLSRGGGYTHTSRSEVHISDLQKETEVSSHFSGQRWNKWAQGHGREVSGQEYWGHTVHLYFAV